MKKFNVQYYFSRDGYVSPTKLWETPQMVRTKKQAEQSFKAHMQEKNLKHFHISAVKEAA